MTTRKARVPKRKLPYQEVHIPIPLFKSGVIVLLSKDIPRCVANIRKWFEGDFDEWDSVSIHGKTIYKEGYNGVVVWLPQYPKTPYELSVAFHEIFHATIRIMTDRMETQLNRSTEETFAYLGEFISRKLFEDKGSKRKLKLSAGRKAKK
jgi:hypothetical protein